MKTIVALLAFLSTALSAQSQTNVYNLNYTMDGFITVGNNRSTIKAPGALTKTYGETWRQPVKLGSLVRFTHFFNPSEKSGSPRCDWCVKSVTKLGGVVKDKDGRQIAKTDGGFAMVTFTLANTGTKSIYLNSDSLFIDMKQTAKDFKSNPQLPHRDSDNMVGEDNALSQRYDLPPGITRTYAVVFEVPLNIKAATFAVQPLSDDVGADRIRVPVTLW